MPLDRIYIARHGYRLNWTTTTWKSPTGLARDPPLTAYGETQAKELADYFSSLPESLRPTAIFSSPYYRCLQTSQPTAKALNIPIYVEHGISEWYSPIVPGSGLHPRPGSPTSLKSFFPEIDTIWSPLWYPSQKGEEVSEVHDRADGFLKFFIPQVESMFRGEHSRILLVSHAATVITLARSLMKDRQVPISVGCCSLSEFVPKEQENGTLLEGEHDVIGAWEAKKLADGAHLENGASREWGFQDIEISAGKVVEDPGVPGSEGLKEGPTGAQVAHSLL